MNYTEMIFGLPECNPAFVEHQKLLTEDGPIWHSLYHRRVFIEDQNSSEIFNCQDWAIDEFYNMYFDANDGDRILACHKVQEEFELYPAMY